MFPSSLMDYVGEDALQAARKMEERLQKLPAEAGILFASVRAVPVEGGASREFVICLGMSRAFEEKTGFALMYHVFEEEVRSGRNLDIKVYRGVTGACRDNGPETARPTAS